MGKGSFVAEKRRQKVSPELNFREKRSAPRQNGSLVKYPG